MKQFYCQSHTVSTKISEVCVFRPPVVSINLFYQLIGSRILADLDNSFRKEEGNVCWKQKWSGGLVCQIGIICPIIWVRQLRLSFSPTFSVSLLFPPPFSSHLSENISAPVVDKKKQGGLSGSPVVMAFPYHQPENNYGIY